jgi:predicted NAD/FAD-dependent oxidoreductase
MSSLAAHLARGLTIRSGVHVRALDGVAGAWRLEGADSTTLGEFDVALVMAPGPQARPLLAECPELAEAAGRARLRPCWAALAAFDRPLDVPLDGTFVEHPVLSWAARDSSKPGRPAGETWVLHAGAGWSERNLERDPRDVGPALISAFSEALVQPLPQPAYLEAHRWRFALPDPPLDRPYLYAPAARLGAGGDWCGGPRIEGAFLSGAELADCLLAHASAGE